MGRPDFNDFSMRPNRERGTRNEKQFIINNEIRTLEPNSLTRTFPGNL
jgi:hypothetical protein